jgi:hypothetical protein
MTAKQIFLVPMVAILLLAVPPAYAAKEGMVQAIVPWEGEGRVFSVGPKTVMFLGSLTGVMYVENADGDMHEAFVVCPIVQEINMETGASEGSGRCEVTSSAETVAYAKLSCKGRPGECAGVFTLTGGEGEWADISGSGELSVRSPIRTLIADMPNGAVLRVASGLAVISNLKYSIPE